MSSRRAAPSSDPGREPGTAAYGIYGIVLFVAAVSLIRSGVIR
jgi:hypothetical protein